MGRTKGSLKSTCASRPGHSSWACQSIKLAGPADRIGDDPCSAAGGYSLGNRRPHRVRTKIGAGLQSKPTAQNGRPGQTDVGSGTNHRDLRQQRKTENSAEAPGAAHLRDAVSVVAPQNQTGRGDRSVAVGVSGLEENAAGQGPEA